MKYSTFFLAPLFILALVTAPLAAFAQIDEGSSESTNTRRQQIWGYRSQSNDMQQKVAALSNIASSSVYMPILFGVSVSNISPNFGDPRSGGRSHAGEDIMAPKGTPIVSPTPAVVLRIGLGEREGNSVYTANPAGETFVYMHLDRVGEGVAAGTVLEQGSLIGYVGNTGNASGGADHLHFEIHDNSGTPTDPFPRLTSEFSLQEKVTYFSKILTQATDSTTLARLMVINFRSTFVSAQAANISLPTALTDALASVPAGTAPVSAVEQTLATGDLNLGSSGSLVVALQTYLIQAGTGAAATRLAGAGATGNFGPMTQAALIEYQLAKGLTPAVGYYGPTTRAYIASHPLATAVQAPTTVTPPVASSSTGTLSRNLYLGVVGQDVLALQQFLNAHGYIVATSGAGSKGNETTYFGPATQAAVITFQTANNIAPAVGYVGMLTRTGMLRL